MVREQDCPLVPQRTGDQFALFIADRHARPTFQKRAVFVQRAEVHVRDLQRHFQHRQRGHMGGVRVDDAVHIRTGTVHPAVEAIGRVRHAVAFKHLQVFVDQQQIAGSDFIKSQAQLLGVIGAGLWPAGGDLPGQTGVVAVFEQNAAGECQLLPVSPRIIRQRILHLHKRLLDQLLFREC